MLIIAEIGGNHCGDMSRARELIRLAKYGGADIAKFQLYDVDKIKRPGDTNYDELKKVQLSKNQMYMLNECCQKNGIEFMASVFDMERFEWTESINMKRYKIASRSIYDTELIDKIVSTNKPIIASLGAWKEPWFPEFKVDFLFCKSRRNILKHGLYNPPMPESFSAKGYVGFSDHYVGMEWIKIAIGRGAEIIEKHFTIDKNLPGWDQPGSMDLVDLISLKKIVIEKEREK